MPCIRPGSGYRVYCMKSLITLETTHWFATLLLLGSLGSVARDLNETAGVHNQPRRPSARFQLTSLGLGHGDMETTGQGIKSEEFGSSPTRSP